MIKTSLSKNGFDSKHRDKQELLKPMALVFDDLRASDRRYMIDVDTTVVRDSTKTNNMGIENVPELPDFKCF